MDLEQDPADRDPTDQDPADQVPSPEPGSARGGRGPATRRPSVARPVVAPLAGAVRPLADVPDRVFAQGLPGCGVALDPGRDGPVEAVAPIGGRVVVIHAHAFVVAGDDGAAILVHLGIGTVQLRGEGFDLLVEQGEVVEAGQPVVRWDPGAVERGGRSPLVPVIAMDTPDEALADLTEGHVGAGDRLWTWVP
ncbi:PTS glucose transporter subunit IIA [Pseudokineococcus sp. 5B2Z-1]|uniref:PTS sugar transporter subunit IIA n=1 Tax=Pseudokineococcus sp. 5B2Z-1 TaxID=3132744 RepID=UPI0030ACA932